MGRPCARCAGVPAIFNRYFGSKYSSEVLAVGGDLHNPLGLHMRLMWLSVLRACTVTKPAEPALHILS